MTVVPALRFLVAWVRTRTRADERGVVTNSTIWLIVGILAAIALLIFIIIHLNIHTKK